LLCALVVEARWETEHEQPREALARCREGLAQAGRWLDTHLMLPALHVEAARAHLVLNSPRAAAAHLEDADRLVTVLADAGALPGWAAEVRRQLPDGASAPAQRGSTTEPSPAPIEALSSREVQVLRLLSGSMSLREIANELYLSVNTLKSHCKSVYRKLGVGSREEAVIRGRSMGLTP
jgi:LuxR family maltose regulon positive regulatory protein